METTLVLDVHDDRGEIFRSIYPTPADVPESVKTAHVLTAEERAALPDNVFALALYADGPEPLRKFACIDQGNTELAIGFFAQTGHLLEGGVQQVTAENLKVACAWYLIDAPEWLDKVASGAAILSGVGKAMRVNQGIGYAKDVAANRSAAASLGPGVYTPDQVLQAKYISKSAEAGESIAPAVPAAKPAAGASPPVVKTGRVMRACVKCGAEVGETKTASAPREDRRFALGSRYPLDSLVEIKTASAYFDENWRDFAPADRRTYAVALVKRASEIGLEVSARARNYAAEDYADVEHLKLARDVRANLLSDEHRVVLNRVFEKSASLAADEFALVLEQFDHHTGLSARYDSWVPDAYASTFREKTAAAPPQTPHRRGRAGRGA